MTTFNLSRRAMLGAASAMLVPAIACAAIPKRPYVASTFSHIPETPRRLST